MRKRYKPLGKNPERIFARSNAAEEAVKKELVARVEREEEEINALAVDPVFKSWISRIVRQQGGVLVNAIRTEAGQAQGMTLYYIVADLARVEAGHRLVSEIVSEQFANPKKGNG